MYDSVRIKTTNEDVALSLAQLLQARFHLDVVHGSESEWEVRVESESEDDVPDVLSILRERFRAPDAPVEVLVDGESYSLQRVD